MKLFMKTSDEMNFSRSCYRAAELLSKDTNTLETKIMVQLYYMKGCLHGNAMSCIDLAELYYNEAHALKSHDRLTLALSTLRMCCEKDVPACCWNLARMYTKDMKEANFHKDFNMAAIYLDKACHLGHYMSCRYLQAWYTMGYGVKINSKRAEKYYEMAKDIEDKMGEDYTHNRT
ncbi:cytochrome c oxidase assembly factor 7B-like [Periplaneta americana]|uniref:cytochrome c oxidase assembly factor 7B-like n=1 Tax=Periplaneta americana TaxID=6978 RepID=UPI0037E82765